MNHKLVIIICAIMLLALVSCEKAPTPTPTAVPTNTPLPTNTPIPPTDTPVPTPTATPVPPLDPVGLDTLNLVDSIVIIENTTKNESAGEQPEESTSISTYEYIKNPYMFHLQNSTIGAPDDATSLFGVGEGEKLMIDVYDNDELMVMQAGTTIIYISKTSQVASQIFEASGLDSSLGELIPSDKGLDMSQGYGFLQWLGPLPYAGTETLNDTPCWKYTFDQTNLLLDKLPEGMVVEELTGNICVAESGNYLVHQEMSMSGQNLYLSAPEPVESMTASDTSSPSVEDGSLTYSIDISQMNRLADLQVPEDLMADSKPPEDVVLHETATPVMVIKGLMGINMFIYQAEADTQVVSEFYITEMATLGWTLDAQEPAGEGVTLQYSKEGLSYGLMIDKDPDSGMTMIILMDMSSAATSATP